MRRGAVTPPASAAGGPPGRAGEGLRDVQPAVGVRRRRPCRARSARCRRWVTRRQKSSAGPVTRCAASSGPHVHAPPSGAVSSTRNSSAGGGRPFCRKAKSRVRTPRCATCRSRAGHRRRIGRARRRRPAPCAQVSMSRAVAIEAALIGGPNQGSRAPSGRPASCSARAVRPARQRASSRSGASVDPASAASSTAAGGRSAASATARANAVRIGGGEQRLLVGPAPDARSGGRSSSPRPGWA